MKAQMSLLSLAIASGLALAAIPAEAAGNLKSAAISRANVLLGANGASAIRAANGDVFAAREAIVDADGTEHVRFQRSYRGLPVIGGDFVMHSRNGKLRNVSQSLKSAARPNLVATFGSDEAIVEAGARFGSKFFGAPTSRMVSTPAAPARCSPMKSCSTASRPTRPKPRCITSSMRAMAASSSSGTTCRPLSLARVAAVAPAPPPPSAAARASPLAMWC